MDRNTMIEGIMRNAGISKANVARFYEGLIELARKELAHNKQFVLPGLGVLRVRARRARVGRNPRTGEKLRIPARKVVRFRTYRALDELLNGPRKPAATTAPGSEPEPTLPLPEPEGPEEPIEAEQSPEPDQPAEQ